MKPSERLQIAAIYMAGAAVIVFVLMLITLILCYYAVTPGYVPLFVAVGGIAFVAGLGLLAAFIYDISEATEGYQTLAAAYMKLAPKTATQGNPPAPEPCELEQHYERMPAMA